MKPIPSIKIQIVHVQKSDPITLEPSEDYLQAKVECGGCVKRFTTKDKVEINEFSLVKLSHLLREIEQEMTGTHSIKPK